MNELLILFILKINKANIYEIRKQINTLFAPFMQISTGTIIPTLKQFANKNYVQKEETISDGGLKKSTYSIMPEGEEYFNNLINRDIVAAPQIIRRDIEIIFMLLNHHVLTQEQNNILIQKVKDAITQNIKLIQSSILDNKMNIEFLHIELVYMEAKLRLLNDIYEA